jgi:probable rRNA maturation factor
VCLLSNANDENSTSPLYLPEDARRVEESLVLAVACEPPEALGETFFGLDDAALRRIVAFTLARVGVTQPIELSLLVTDDDGLRALNREYRGQDEPTDVLSFPLRDAPLIAAPADQLWQPIDAVGDEPDANEDVAALDDMAHDAMAYDAYDAAGHSEDMVDAMDGDAAIAEEAADEAAVPGPDDEHLHLGDIALSRDAIGRQAAQAGHSPARELAYLLAHGVLHLVGYDDTTDAGYEAMVAYQEAILRDAGISG